MLYTVLQQYAHSDSSGKTTTEVVLLTILLGGIIGSAVFLAYGWWMR